MMNNMIASAVPVLAGTLFVCGAAVAQKTWIVDAAGGTGTNYKDLPAAVQAASAGDVLLIRRGSYKPATITKGLRLLGEAGAMISTAPTTSLVEVPLRVERLPAGQVCVLHGLSIQGARGSTVLELSDNSGSVVLRNLTLGYSAPVGDFTLRIARSKAVHVTNCTASMGASILSSTVAIAGSSFSRKKASFPINGSKVAIEVTSSNLDLIAVQATGQTGVPPYLHSRPALSVAGSSKIRILGDATSIYQPGAFNKFGASNPALQGQKGSTLEIDPRVVLKSTGTASKHTGFGQVRSRRIPILSTSGGALGGSVVVDLRSQPKDRFVVGVSLPGTPADLPPLGRTWFDASTLIPVAFGTQGATGQWRQVLPVANKPAFRGLPLVWQSVTASGSFVELTNPAVVVVH